MGYVTFQIENSVFVLFSDACQSSPCAHGSCISSANQYNCSCFPGYTGRNCNIGKTNFCNIGKTKF